jgi:hypothetical protein
MDELYYDPPESWLEQNPCPTKQLAKLRWWHLRFHPIVSSIGWKRSGRIPALPPVDYLSVVTSWSEHELMLDSKTSLDQPKAMPRRRFSLLFAWGAESCAGR